MEEGVFIDMSVLIAVLVTLAAVYLATTFAIAWLSVHPMRTPIFLSPESFGVAQQSVEFQSAGRRLRGWWLEAPEARLVAVLAHGYVMNRAELTPVAAALSKRGVTCLLLDFRAHGKSEGLKCGLGWSERADVSSAVEYARLKAPGAKVVLIGSSMGAAACAFAVAEDPDLADALVLDSAYSRLDRAIAGWWRFLGGKPLAAALWPVPYIAVPIAGFRPWKVDVAAALKSVAMPVLIIHGEEDNLALPTEALLNQAACGGEVVWLPRSGHTEGRWLHPDLYMRSLDSFLTRHGLLPSESLETLPRSAQ